MAVTSFKEIHDGRDGDDEFSKDSAARRYTRVFRAVTDANTDDSTVVLANASCPALGAAHPNDSGAYCRRRRARNESFSKRVWLVTCSYSSEYEADANPINDPVEIEWNTEQFQRPYYRDREGNAILNSAGDPYDPLVEGDDSRWSVTITKNMAAPPAWLLLYRDAVNSDAFTIDGVSVAAECAKLQSISIGKEEERNGTTYRPCRFTLHIASDGTDEGSGSGGSNTYPTKPWAKNILDAGFRAWYSTDITGSGTFVTYRKITDDDGEPIKSPALLDGNGNKLENPSPATAVFREHEIYNVLPFNGYIPLA